MEIHMNITFPRLPCELLTLDVMDVSGEQQVGVVHGVNKVRLGPASEGGKVLDVEKLELYVSTHVQIEGSEVLMMSPATPPPMSPFISTPTTAGNAAAHRLRPAPRNPDAATRAKKCGRPTPSNNGHSAQERTSSSANASGTRNG